MAIEGSIEVGRDDKLYTYDELKGQVGQLVVYRDLANNGSYLLDDLRIVTEAGLASLDGRLQTPSFSRYSKLPIGTKITLEVTA